MPPQNFRLLSRMGGLALGQFPYPSWHKREPENILRAVGVDVEYGEVLDAGVERGNYKTVGNKEHMQIVSLYAEGHGYQKIHEKLNRSTKTIFEHVHKHNDAVQRSGFCAICKRVGGKHENEVVSRRKGFAEALARAF